jgi:hypothetical protein
VSTRRFVDTVGPLPADGDELDLPVDGLADDLDVVERTGERRGELRERRRDVRDRHAGLLGVRAVVDPDGEDLPRRRYGGAEVGVHEGPRGGRDRRCELDERRPVVVDGHGVGPESALGCRGDVGDLVAEDEGGAAVDVGELHKWAPSKGRRAVARWVRRSSSSVDASAALGAVP